MRAFVTSARLHDVAVVIIHGDLVAEGVPWVYLQEMDKLLEKHPLPPFAHGRILDTTP